LLAMCFRDHKPAAFASRKAIMGATVIKRGCG
jgi:hypothetical protein